MVPIAIRIAATLLAAVPAAATSAALPGDVARQLPAGFDVIASASSAPVPARKFVFVALASTSEAKQVSAGRSPVRPLLLFEARRPGRYVLAGRNDEAILHADDGGINRCDPFEGLAVKGTYVTVEQGVACGAHWTDYVTFRFDRRAQAYVFDNWRTQSWSLNPSGDPKAEALVTDGQKIVRAGARAMIFAKWRRPRD